MRAADIEAMSEAQLADHLEALEEISMDTTGSDIEPTRRQIVEARDLGVDRFGWVI